jgi:hypothetical protein
LAAVNACRKLAVNLGDSIELRVILSLLYTITIVLRSHPDTHLRENFVSELSKFVVFLTFIRDSLLFYYLALQK